VKYINNCAYIDQDDSPYLFASKHDENSLNLDVSPKLSVSHIFYVEVAGFLNNK
jgi:hypothetical protein